MKIARISAIILSGILAVVILILSLTPFVAHNATLDYLSGYRFLYLLLALVLSLTFAVLSFRRRSRLHLALLLCAAVALVTNWIEIRPFFYPPKNPPALSANPTVLRLISFNLKESNRSHAEVMKFVREEEPDVIIFLETTKEWRKALSSLNEEFQQALIYSKPGILIFSRVWIEKHEQNLIGGNRGDVHLTLDGRLELYASHAHPWSAHGEEGFAWRNEQLLERIGTEIGKSRNPTVVLGDLNASLWSPTYKEMLSRSKLRDARLGFGPLRTQSSFGLFFLLGLPIDHCLVSDEVEVRLLRTGPSLGSDHLPLIVDIAF